MRSAGPGAGKMTGSRGDLTWRCRTAIWWRSTRISVFLTLPGAGQQGQPAAQPRRSGRAGRSRELIVPESELAPLLADRDLSGSRNPSSGADGTVFGTHKSRLKLRGPD
jgi:hypothetical protein